jgi:methyl-accepting chemotaxis protein
MAYWRTRKGQGIMAGQIKANTERIEESDRKQDAITAILTDQGFKINGHLAALMSAEGDKRFAEGKEEGRKQALSEFTEHAAKLTHEAKAIAANAQRAAETAQDAARRAAETVERVASADPPPLDRSNIDGNFK